MLLEWLQHESQGLPVLDQLAGMTYMDEKYLLTCSSYASALMAYSHAQGAEFMEVKFRWLLSTVAKKL